MQKNPTLLVGDTQYQMSKFYLDGARAYRKQAPFWENPHNEDTQRYHDWNCGYENDEAGEHQRFEVDLVEECESGKFYDEDPSLKRDANGYLIQNG